MRTFDSWNLWFVAFAVMRGVRLVGMQPGRYVGFTLADEQGQATALWNEWRTGQATVSAKEYVDSYRDLLRSARAQS